MAAFAYTAVDPAGKTVKGIAEASNAAAARQWLRARQLTPVSIEPTKAGRGAPAMRRTKSVSIRSLTLVTRQLATLIGSGIAVEQSLKTVADQSDKPAVSTLLAA